MKHPMRAVMLTATLTFLSACKGQSGSEKTAASKKTTPALQTTVGTVLRTASTGDKAAPLRILRKGMSDWTIASANTPIQAEDRVSTGPSAVAVIRLSKGNEPALNAGTAVQVMSASSLKLEQGELWINADAPLVVETKMGKATVESGAGGIRYIEDKLVVSWISGKALLEGKRGSLSLMGGNEAVADATGVHRTVIKDPSALVAWTQKVRDAVSTAAADSAAMPPAVPAGLGTLTARLPGGSKLLPFTILAEDIQVHIQDNMAVTRIEQIFQNPSNQVVEAEYRFPIPENAFLTGYDMEVNGRLMRGEIVERDRGRKIMKKVIADYLDLMRDPALTEWESGTTFKTRIFPIQPKEKKRIVLSHLMPLSGAAGEYRFGLPVSMGATDSPVIPKFRIDAEIASASGLPSVSTPLYAARIEALGNTVKVGFESDNFIPRADFVMAIRTPSVKEASLTTFGKEPHLSDAVSGNVQPTISDALVRGEDNTFLLRIAPTLEQTDSVSAENSDWLFLVDTSESRFGPDMEIEKRLVGALIDILGPADRVKVMGFDTFPVLMDTAWAAPSSALIKRVAEFFSRVEPGGATNLEDALIAARAEADPKRPMKVLLIGDGRATLGETAPGQLADLAGRLFEYPHSVCAVGIGSSIDRLLLENLTGRTRGRYFSVSGGEDLLTAAVRVAAGLRAPVLEAPEVSLNGIAVSEVVPASLPNVLKGGELLIAGRYHGAGKMIVALTGTLDQHPWRREWTFDVGSSGSSNTFVPLVWAAKKIDALTLEDGEISKKELISLSKKYAIASRYTSFIVLENAAMYREFNVDRPSDRLAWQGDEEIGYENSDSALPEEDLSATMDRDDPLMGIGSGAGMSGLSGAPKAKRSFSPAKSAPASPSAEISESADYLKKDESVAAGPPASDIGLENEFGMISRGEYVQYRPRPSYLVTVRQPASAPSTAALEKARELASAAQAAPLNRRTRRDLVRYLLQIALLDEASRALSEWSVVDRSNPEVHLLAGDLYRLQGDMPAALRALSSAIDLQPDSSRIMESLAAYFESHERWKEALPFQVSLSALKPTDNGLRVRRAISALKAGRTDEAVRIAQEMIEPDRMGYPTVKKGVKLSKSDKDTVLSIAASKNLPILYDTVAQGDFRSAGLKAALAWDRPSNLDLWVSTNKDKYLGGAFGKARLISGASRQEKVFLVSGNAEGRYLIQVLCADKNGCDNVSGRLTVESHGKNRVIPFVLRGALGKDLAVIRIEKQNFRW